MTLVMVLINITNPNKEVSKLICNYTTSAMASILILILSSLNYLETESIVEIDFIECAILISSLFVMIFETLMSKQSKFQNKQNLRSLLNIMILFIVFYFETFIGYLIGIEFIWIISTINVSKDLDRKCIKNLIATSSVSIGLFTLLVSLVFLNDQVSTNVLFSKFNELIPLLTSSSISSISLFTVVLFLYLFLKTNVLPANFMNTSESDSTINFYTVIPFLILYGFLKLLIPLEVILNASFLNYIQYLFLFNIAYFSVRSFNSNNIEESLSLSQMHLASIVYLLLIRGDVEEVTITYCIVAMMIQRLTSVLYGKNLFKENNVLLPFLFLAPLSMNFYIFMKTIFSTFPNNIFFTLILLTSGMFMYLSCFKAMKKKENNIGPKNNYMAYSFVILLLIMNISLGIAPGLLITIKNIFLNSVG